MQQPIIKLNHYMTFSVKFKLQRVLEVQVIISRVVPSKNIATGDKLNNASTVYA